MRIFAIAVNALVAILLTAIALPMVLLIVLFTALFRLARWAEFHAVYGGNAAERDKARWRS